jgi:hypothetical protein
MSNLISLKKFLITFSKFGWLIAIIALILSYFMQSIIERSLENVIWDYLLRILNTILMISALLFFTGIGISILESFKNEGSGKPDNEEVELKDKNDH